MKDKYLTYNIEEFASDEDFIAWVLEGVHSDEWENWLESHSDMKKTVDEAKWIVDGIQFAHQPIDPVLKKDMWANIDAAITSSDQKGSSKTRRIFIISSVAAAAVIVFILYSIFTMNDGMLISTEIGGQELVQLPDNSLIKLNSVSEVQYDEDKFRTERKLNLNGEAFFEVEKGSRFTVETDLGNVEVLGTSFNVYARKDSFAVSCYTGRVQVTSESGQQIILNPGEEIELGNVKTGMEKISFEIEENTPSWTNGLFTFENEPLSVVFEELKRQYNITIEYQDPSIPLQNTGVLFFESGNLDEALKNIAFTEKLEYSIEGRKVVLSK